MCLIWITCFHLNLLQNTALKISNMVKKLNIFWTLEYVHCRTQHILRKSGFARSARSTTAYGPLLRFSGRTPLLRFFDKNWLFVPKKLFLGSDPLCKNVQSTKFNRIEGVNITFLSIVEKVTDSSFSSTWNDGPFVGDSANTMNLQLFHDFCSSDSVF